MLQQEVLIPFILSHCNCPKWQSESCTHQLSDPPSQLCSHDPSPATRKSSTAKKKRKKLQGKKRPKMKERDRENKVKQQKMRRKITTNKGIILHVTCSWGLIFLQSYIIFDTIKIWWEKLPCTVFVFFFLTKPCTVFKNWKRL